MPPLLLNVCSKAVQVLVQPTNAARPSFSGNHSNSSPSWRDAEVHKGDEGHTCNELDFQEPHRLELLSGRGRNRGSAVSVPDPAFRSTSTRSLRPQAEAMDSGGPPLFRLFRGDQNPEFVGPICPGKTRCWSMGVVAGRNHLMRGWKIVVGARDLSASAKSIVIAIHLRA